MYPNAADAADADAAGGDDDGGDDDDDEKRPPPLPGQQSTMQLSASMASVRRPGIAADGSSRRLSVDGHRVVDPAARARRGTAKRASELRFPALQAASARSSEGEDGGNDGGGAEETEENSLLATAVAAAASLPPMTPLEVEREGIAVALKLLRLLAVSTHGLGLSEAHAHELIEDERPAARRLAMQTSPRARRKTHTSWQRPPCLAPSTAALWALDGLGWPRVASGLARIGSLRPSHAHPHPPHLPPLWPLCLPTCRRDGAVWALACQHVAPFVQQLAGVWSFPHACFAQGLRPVVLQGGVGAEEHSELAEYFLCLLDPSFDSTFQGSDEPLALIGAPFHLLRCASATSNSPALAQLCGLLRCRALAVRFATAVHTPPLPVLLLESLCRGHDGTRSAEHVKLLQPETPAMLAACALPTTPTAAFPEAGGEGAAAIAGVLQRIAKRLELAQRAAEARAAERREQNQLHRGISVRERAVSHIQRSGRAYIFSHRQRTANDDRRRRYNERLAKRAATRVQAKGRNALIEVL